MDIVRQPNNDAATGDALTLQRIHHGELSKSSSEARHGSFPHEKLDAYHIALEMARRAKTLAQKVPRGHRNVADHLLRSSSNAVLLLAEGANRRGKSEKRQRFVESRGESGEVAAACDLIIALELAAENEALSVKQLAGRVCAMLSGLIGRTSQ
jgi:four helix bundle protein